MTGAAYRVEVGGLKELESFFSRLDSPDLSNMWDAIAREGRKQTADRIEMDKTAPDGTPWPEVSAKWQKRKSQKSSGGVLEYQDDLVDSLTSNAGADFAEWGSNLAYAATHQFGDDKRNIPQREFLGISDENADDMLAIAQDELEYLIDG